MIRCYAKGGVRQLHKTTSVLWDFEIRFHDVENTPNQEMCFGNEFPGHGKCEKCGKSWKLVSRMWNCYFQNMMLSLVVDLIWIEFRCVGRIRYVQRTFACNTVCHWSGYIVLPSLLAGSDAAKGVKSHLRSCVSLSRACTITWQNGIGRFVRRPKLQPR